MSDVVIRRPHPPSFAAECDAAAAIYLDSRRLALLGLREPRSGRATRAWFREVVFPRYAIRLAAVEGEIVGYAARDGAWLMHLYVKPGWTGKGIGKALLDAVVEEAGTRVPVLRSRVFTRNAGARRFFERHGFAATAFGDGADNEEREPDAVCERALGQTPSTR
jgi:GNAT superfamily N-acetyltransferase